MCLNGVMENINALYKNTRYSGIYVGVQHKSDYILKRNRKACWFPSIIKFSFFHFTVYKDVNLGFVFCGQQGCFVLDEKWNLMID